MIYILGIILIAYIYLKKRQDKKTKEVLEATLVYISTLKPFGRNEHTEMILELQIIKLLKELK